MKEKVIKKILNKKKPITSIFLIVTSFCLLVLGTFFLLMMFNTNFSNSIAEIKGVFISFVVIGLVGLIFTLYLMKFTNKLNIMKISKDELEILYDKYIDDNIINELENKSKLLKLEYQESKKTSCISLIITIVIIIITGGLIFVEGINESVRFLLEMVCIVSTFFLIAKIEIAFKSVENLVNKDKENMIIEKFLSHVDARNKQIIKENKSKNLKKKNSISFWFVEIFLLMLCLASLNEEVLSLIKTEGIYGIIAIVIIIGVPAFFFVRNIYKRYFL